MAEPRKVEQIALDYQRARAAADTAAMSRFQNEEACLVLLALLERLASEPTAFVHQVAVKGGILMAGELRSPRVSADIDFTSGHLKRVDSRRAIREVVRAGRRFNVRADGDAERTTGGEIIHLRFDSLTDGGTAKLEISVREDLVFAVRDAVFNLTELGIAPFAIPALAEVELVAEKLRALVQRAQPRDLFDLRLYLVDSGWFLDPSDLSRALAVKLEATRHKRWKPNLWRIHLDEIEDLWASTLENWILPAKIPTFDETVAVVDKRLRELRLG